MVCPGPTNYLLSEQLLSNCRPELPTRGEAEASTEGAAVAVPWSFTFLTAAFFGSPYPRRFGSWACKTASLCGQ
jgi:hypothetical protein